MGMQSVYGGGGRGAGDKGTCCDNSKVGPGTNWIW